VAIVVERSYFGHALSRCCGVRSELREDLQASVGDRYLIERELAGGGMSRLFLATERGLNRQVVIKLLPPELTSELSAARFQREIELAAQLLHPHILPVYSAGTEQGLLHYVMPFVAGESLRLRLLRDGRLPITDAARILRQVAEALGYAHQMGVVHRDIKPENILLAHGHAMVADFGIARALAGGDSGGRLTGTGMAIGTLGYMAPEQAAGEQHIDARADVYSLAVVGYEMLAGAPPFAGNTPQAVLAAQLTRDAVPVASLRPEVPAALCDAIQRALARDPEARFRTAGEFREAFDGAASSVAADAPVRPSGRNRQGVSSLVSGARRLLQHFRPQPATEVSACTAAIFPFAVLGNERLAYLREGLVDLLSTRLDGMGTFCVSDPRAVLGMLAQEQPRALTPETGRGIASRLGAGLFVLGSLVEVAGRLQLNASLYDADGKLQTTAQAAVGDESQIFQLVDEVAIQLLAGQERGQGSRLVGLAASTTHSLSALRAYLQGERLYRIGQYTPAMEFLRRSVDADPTFALAWYRLSVAAEWASHRALQDEAAEQALRRSDRLSEHDRQLLEAFVAWRRGDQAAESMYRNIVGAYPNDVEAWCQLAEVIFHNGPLTGRSIAESREAWERVLFFEPEHLGALYHLGRIAAVEGNGDKLRELTDRVLTLSPTGERALEVRALRAFALGDAAEQRQVVDELRQAGDFTLNVTLRTVATYTRNLQGAVTLARLCTEESRAGDFRGLAHVMTAHLELARGRLGAAREELAAGAALGSPLAIEARGLVALLPFLPSPRAALESARDDLLAWDAATVPRSESASLFLRIHDGIHPQLRSHLLALLHLRLGDEAGARAHAAALEGAADGPGHAAALARFLRLAIDAHAAIARGEGTSALAMLEQMHPTCSWGYDSALASAFYSLALERFTRAELLAAEGRLVEACRWYSSFAEASIYDLVFLAPSHLRRAELHERMGEPDKARQHYERFLHLWGECDAELAPVVAAARARLEASLKEAASVAPDLHSLR
jgi:serine/threonine-protein kinase